MTGNRALLADRYYSMQLLLLQLFRVTHLGLCVPTFPLLRMLTASLNVGCGGSVGAPADGGGMMCS